MDNYDYDGEYANFDSQDFDTLGDTTGWNGEGGPGYAGFQTPQSNNNGGYDFQQEWNNFAGQDQYYQDPMGNQAWMNPSGSTVGTMAPGGSFEPTDKLTPALGGVQNTLANLFNNKGFVTGLGALAEGYQNKKKAAALQQMVNQNRQPLDPFGSQRPFYQQQLQQAVQDPYSAPIVSAQVEQLKRAQDIKNAAAGRRSNSATTDPALMAAMAGVAQNYMNSLQTPAGANISPQGLSSLLSAQQQGINNDVNGYLSPALSAMGRSAGMDQNTKTLEALRELLTGGK